VIKTVLGGHGIVTFGGVLESIIWICMILWFTMHTCVFLP